jgi:carnitine 3-dehydrogenase
VGNIKVNKRVAVVGCGTIGAGWIARLLLYGYDVSAFDRDPETAAVCEHTITRARAAIRELGSVLPDEGTFQFANSLTQCIADASVVLECLPENLDIKKALYRELESILESDALLFSSTSGFKPCVLGEGLAFADRLLVCHPFNPVYLLPLVEVVPHASCSTEVQVLCKEMLTSIGMRPLMLRHEIDGHVADRLLEAMWREALWLINDDLATTSEIDDAIKYGFGLRMAHMGLFETYRLGGGEGGFRQFLAQFGPALQWPWSHLTHVPELDDALVDKIVKQSDEQTAGLSQQQLVARRDASLIAILKGLASSS